MNKAAVKRRLAVLARSLDPLDLGTTGTSAVTVEVAYGPPGDDIGDTCIYFAAAEAPTGESTPAYISTRQPAEDIFLVSTFADAYGFDTCEEAEEAAERIFNAFDALLSTWQRLVPPGNPHDDPAGGLVDSAYVTTTALRSGKGDGDTWGGRYEFTVQCKTPLRYP